MKSRTDFSIEKSIEGPVIGLDEVGRGPLAGPVVSCGCLFNRYDRLPENIQITDFVGDFLECRRRSVCWR